MPIATLATTTLDALWTGLPGLSLALVVGVHLVATRLGDLRDREAPIGADAPPRCP